ncbi:SDR family NAD(P)-dependent oxidoreductase [Desulfatitalea alkaliphila]|uniref:SDR family NAD(P)-dependent oxidoreductase n=1 Tax=Desulfatitalea alkaliphila TaxID=2929485 RepID=A0AA41R3F3_9BACT|nr:SDR family NAD(P)-dependent oxidoreductase [Desulfatitalea alkaliphila]MCJ8500335.1 SDR family NAD(P)-dependent oxidoreductase [Desulfatitalea alkaliphila]
MAQEGEGTAYVITGTTRGIGKALADAVAERGQPLFSISRAPEGPLAGGWNFACDLRFAEQIDQAMARLTTTLEEARCRQVVLICNAGVLGPVGFIHRLSPERMAEHVQVNLLAPLQLMGCFIADSAARACPRRIVLITSGAGRHPYAGWSLYCAAKAGLDMAMRCIALEQGTRPDGVGVCAVAPGVVATDMQKEIRDADDADFPNRSRFIEFQESGGLASPRSVAETLLDLDGSGQLVSGGLYDLRDVNREGGTPTIAPRNRLDAG